MHSEMTLTMVVRKNSTTSNTHKQKGNRKNLKIVSRRSKRVRIRHERFPASLRKENELNRIDGRQVYIEHGGRLPLPDFPPTKYLTADKYDYTDQIEFPENGNGVRHYSFPAFYRSESSPRHFYFCTSGNPTSRIGTALAR